MNPVEAANNIVRSKMKHVAVFINRVSGGKITPDMVTTIGVMSHVPIALLIASNQLVAAGILLIIFGLLDVLDGELARLQKTANSRGMVFDASADRIKETIIFSAVAYYLSQNVDPKWVFLAVLALGASISVSYSKAKAEVALALKKQITDHHKLNRFFSEGIASFEIRTSVIIAGLVLNQLLFATIVVAILSSVAMFERLIVYMRALNE